MFIIPVLELTGFSEVLRSVVMQEMSVAVVYVGYAALVSPSF